MCKQPPHLTLALLTVALLPATVAGCGGGSSATSATKPTTAGPLDTHTVAAAIEQSILSERKVHARVSCPRHEPKRKGFHFVCLASTSAGQTPFVVTEVNAAGRVTYVGK